MGKTNALIFLSFLGKDNNVRKTLFDVTGHILFCQHEKLMMFSQEKERQL